MVCAPYNVRELCLRSHGSRLSFLHTTLIWFANCIGLKNSLQKNEEEKPKRIYIYKSSGS